MRRYYIFLSLTIIFSTIQTHSQPVPFLEHTSHNIPALYNGQLLAVDVNKDGWLDLVQTGFDDNQYHFSVLLNNKNFTFSAFSPLSIYLSNPKTAWADIDNDGDIDYVVCGTDNANIKRTIIGINNNDTTFTIYDYNIVGVTLGQPLWADFNNDGKTDLLVYGIDNSGKRKTVLYKNNINNFSEVKQLMGFSSGKTVVLDFNNDGRKDIFITGIDQNGYKKSRLYKNIGNFDFVEINVDIDAVTSGDVAVGDVDDNGWEDIVITGLNQNGQRVCKLYCNIYGSYIEKTGTFIDSLSGSSISICDINNDGKLDIFFTGTDNKAFYKSVFYVNAGNGNFIRDESLIVPLTSSLLLNVDLNNDHRMDLVVSGKTYSGNVCKVFENQAATNNSCPAIPTGLNSTTYSNDSVSLRWNTVLDNEQGGVNIQYNVYVGNSALLDNVVAAQSFIPAGKRLIQQSGNASKQNAFTLHYLSEGKYYWSVQAIDNNYNASGFSSVDSFVICNPVKIGNDTTICQGDTAFFQIPAGPMKCNWYSLHSGLIVPNSFTCRYSPLTSDTIVVECMHDLGCILYDTAIITVIHPLPIHLPTDTAGCFGTTIRLCVDGYFKNARWESATKGFIHADSLAYWHTIVGMDTLKVMVVDTNNCRNSTSVIIQKYDLPQWNAGGDHFVCQYDSIHLTVKDNFKSVLWYNIDGSNIKSSTPEYRSLVVQNDSLLIVVTDTNNCSVSDTLIIYMLPLPEINIGNDTSICYNENIMLHPTRVNGRIDWYSVKTGILAKDTELLQYNVIVPDSIIAIVTDTNNCWNSDTVSITALSLPVFTIGRDTALCYGQSALFSAGTGWKNVGWYTAKEGQLLDASWYIVRNWYSSDTLWAWVTDKQGCKNVDSVFIEVFPLPHVFAGNDTAICYNDTLVLTANNSFPYIQWNSVKNGIVGNTQQILYPILAADTIILSVADFHQCTNTDTVQINVLPLPVISLTSDTFACYGDTLFFALKGQWKQISWTPSIQNNIISDSTYFFYPAMVNDTIHLQVIDLSGCKSASRITVQINRLPYINLQDTAVCRYNCLNLTILDTLVKKIVWSLPGQENIETAEKTLAYCPQTSDYLKVTAMTNKNCYRTDSVYVGVFELPEVSLGPDTVVCYGSRLIIGTGMIKNNTDVKNIIWQGVDTNQVNNYTPEVVLVKDTSFVVTVVDSHHCSSSDTLNILVNPPSEFNLPETLAICYGKTTTIDRPYIIRGSRYAYIFQWYPDSTISDPNAELPEFSPLQTTNYRVIARTWECKPDTAFMTVLVRQLPVINHTPDITIGEKGFIQLYAEGGSKYQWYPANSLNQADIPDPIASPEKTTTYTVMVTDSFGCSNTDTLTVYVGNQIFVPDLFTPNNDGRNDEFKVYGIGILDLTLTITNMQNMILYKSSDVTEITNKGWDGTFKGTPVPEGQYRWHINGKFLNGQQILYRGKNIGTFLLIR